MIPNVLARLLFGWYVEFGAVERFLDAVPINGCNPLLAFRFLIIDSAFWVLFYKLIVVPERPSPPTDTPFPRLFGSLIGLVDLTLDGLNIF